MAPNVGENTVIRTSPDLTTDQEVRYGLEYSRLDSRFGPATCRFGRKESEQITRTVEALSQLSYGPVVLQT
jgi:hypothetical protein